MRTILHSIGYRAFCPDKSHEFTRFWCRMIPCVELGGRSSVTHSNLNWCTRPTLPRRRNGTGTCTSARAAPAELLSDVTGPRHLEVDSFPAQPSYARTSSLKK